MEKIFEKYNVEFFFGLKPAQTLRGGGRPYLGVGRAKAKHAESSSIKRTWLIHK